MLSLLLLLLALELLLLSAIHLSRKLSEHSIESGFILCSESRFLDVVEPPVEALDECGCSRKPRHKPLHESQLPSVPTSELQEVVNQRGSPPLSSFEPGTSAERVNVPGVVQGHVLEPAAAVLVGGRLHGDDEDEREDVLLQVVSALVPTQVALEVLHGSGHRLQRNQVEHLALLVVGSLQVLSGNGLGCPLDGPSQSSQLPLPNLLDFYLFTFL